MTSNTFERWGSLSAVLGLLLWLVLTPFMATIWVYDQGRVVWAQKSLVVRTIGQWLDGFGAFTFDVDEAVYFFYGRFFFLVYLLLIPTLMVFQKRYQGSRIAYLVLLATFLVAGLADFTSYGLGVFSETLWSSGFAIEVLIWIPLIISAVIYGRSVLKNSAGPRWAGWLIVISALLLPFMIFERWLVSYMPNSPMLPTVLTWAVIGVHLWAVQSSPNDSGVKEEKHVIAD